MISTTHPTYSLRDAVRVPGLISLARLPLALAFPFTVGHPMWSLAVLAGAGASDLLDGWYARRFHQETATGAALDGLLDKLFVLVVAATLLAAGRLGVGELLLLGTRDLGEIAIGLQLARRRGLGSLRGAHSANRAGKAATALQFAAVVAVVLEWGSSAAAIAAAGVGGLVAAWSYWRQENRAHGQG